MPYIPSLGTVSHGTLHNADLIVAFADELRRFDPSKLAELADLAEEASALAVLANLPSWSFLWDTEQASELCNELQDGLNELAPSYVYFGNTEGDGSDFGWWPSVESALEDLPHVEAGDETDLLDYVAITDHGNVTLYINGNEVWAVV